MKPHVSTILPFLNRPNGRYVEIGAKDGGKESFTLYLEKCLNWQGLLVEPWPHLFHKCRKRRSRSTALNVAAVDSWLSDSYIEVVGLPPKASIREKLKQEAMERMTGKVVKGPPQRRARNEKHIYYISTNSIQGMLERSNFEEDFDLLVLNLQGYESNALDGIDFQKIKPTFILVRLSNVTVNLPNIPMQYERVATSTHDRMTKVVLFRYADFGSN